MLSKTAMGVAAGVCGTLFIGYCIYFDRKRRSDPLFKKHLKERRAKAQLKKEQDRKKSIKLPDLRDFESVQKFFFQEIQVGEEFLSQGDIENGIEHLGIALAVSGQPTHLLELLQQQLPPQIFQMLMQRLPIVSQKLVNSVAARGMLDDDVEMFVSTGTDISAVELIQAFCCQKLQMFYFLCRSGSL